MAANVLADSSFIVALLNERDRDHSWALAQATRFPPVWKTCDAVVSEAFYLLGDAGMPALAEILQIGSLTCAFQAADHIDDIVKLMKKYDDVPMSFADACLVRMTEVLSNPTVLTADTDFHIYRRHGRQTVPCVTPR